MRLAAAVILALLICGPVAAQDRPVPRPVAEEPTPIRPVARPGPDGTTAVPRNGGAATIPRAPPPASPPVQIARQASVGTVPRGQDPTLVQPGPKVRPANLVEVMSSRGSSGVSVPDSPAIRRSIRPRARVAEATRVARLRQAVMMAPAPVIDADGTLRQSERPAIRPAIRLAAARRLREGRGGGLCGRASIQGQAIAPVAGPGACGIPDAVRVSQVSGVGLSRATRMDCVTARALDDWVRQGMIPTVGGRGGGVVRLEVAAGYACRARNNRAGARLSEHSYGRAIDISGLRLANGQTISVLRDWGRGASGRILAALWRTACGPFGTVLGPNADRYHQDHFHFDTARYRSGSYCR